MPLLGPSQIHSPEPRIRPGSCSNNGLLTGEVRKRFLDFGPEQFSLSSGLMQRSVIWYLLPEVRALCKPLTGSSALSVRERQEEHCSFPEAL